MPNPVGRSVRTLLSVLLLHGWLLSAAKPRVMVPTWGWWKVLLGAAVRRVTS